MNESKQHLVCILLFIITMTVCFIANDVHRMVDIVDTMDRRVQRMNQ